MKCKNCGKEITVNTTKAGFIGDAIHSDNWFACKHDDVLDIAGGSLAEYTSEDFAVLRESFATKRLHHVDPVWDGTTAADFETSNG